MSYYDSKPVRTTKSGNKIPFRGILFPFLLRRETLPVSQQQKHLKLSPPFPLHLALLDCFQCSGALCPACSDGRDCIIVSKMMHHRFHGDCRLICVTLCPSDVIFVQYCFDKQIKGKDIGYKGLINNFNHALELQQ